MSANVCLDPKPFYNLQNLSCEASPDLPKGPKPLQSPVAELTAPSFRPKAHALGLRGIEDFKTVLLSGAAKGSSIPTSKTSQLNPLGFSLLLSLPGCSSDESMKPSKRDAAAETDGSSAGGGGNAGASGMGGAAGTGGSDAGVDHTDGGSGEATLDPAVLFATTPCGSDGTIPDLDQDIGVCANYTDDRHHLFAWDPQNMGTMDGGDGGSSSILQLGFAPDQVLKGTDGKYYITHHGDPTLIPPSPTGLAIIDNDLGMQTQVDFTKVVWANPTPTSGGTLVLQISPSFPKGIAQVGSRLFIATSNLVTRADPKLNYFNPGTVLIFNTQSSSWEHFLTTTDFNPTSMAVVDGKIYVVNSGDINPARDPAQLVTTPSSIDVINPQTLQIEKNIPLGVPGPIGNGVDGGTGAMDASADGGPLIARAFLAAGIQGEIAVSPDGKTLVLPTGDNSGRLIVMDIATQATRTITVTTGEKVLLTGLSFHPSSEYLYVGNFNDGKIYTVDLETGQVVGDQNLDSDTTNFSGISDGLWQGGAVFMGVGPEIYRLPAKY